MVTSVIPASKHARSSGRRSLRWGLAAAAVGVPALVVASWTAVHRVPGLGPWVADSLRAAVGIERVARLEDAAYALEDKFNRYWHHGETPQAHWQVPAPMQRVAKPVTKVHSGAAAHVLGVSLSGNSRAKRVLERVSPALAESVEPVPAEVPSFRPTDIGPVHASWSAPGDGQWLPLSSDEGGRGALFKTLLHPDARRSWAELFVVAIDLSRVRMHLVAGTLEPKATLAEARNADRPGVIPLPDVDRALAAFNGGFKTEHGQYGMRVQGLTLIPENPAACTISYGPDNRLSVGSWERLHGELSTAQWWRQTPNCMFEQGTIHPRLAEGYVNQWGATLSGRTVIRRSALGIDSGGNTLFVAISNHTTAPALARGLHHAGAATIAQLDVNHSYPKFMTFHGSPSSALRFAVPLAEGFEYSEHEYLSKPSRRDFFYLTPRRARTAHTRGIVH